MHDTRAVAKVRANAPAMTTPRAAWCMAHGARAARCTTSGARCQAHGARCTVHGARRTVHGA
eukprot:5728266-Lingulodinium_polyedra.AAC.1